MVEATERVYLCVGEKKTVVGCGEINVVSNCSVMLTSEKI